MNFGYLIFASDNSVIDYVKLAYAAAMTIKHTQKPGYDKVALIVDDKTRLSQIKSPWVFDHVIEWHQAQGWNGRSFMDELSPWDNTVCIDADMLFLRDYSHWIDYFQENCDLYVANEAYTISGNKVVQDYYRKTFVKNDLPNLYSMWTYFNKDADREFFEINRSIIANPTEYKNLFLSKHKPTVLGTDEAFSLAAKLLGIQDQIAYDLDFLKIVHMKPQVQDWPWDTEKVTNHAGFYLNTKGQLKIGNFQQHNPVHYVEKDLITDEVTSILEELIWKKL